MGFRKYLITGGTGSLGRALVNELLARNIPSNSIWNNIVIYSRDEGKHVKYFNNLEGVKCVVGDVRDLEKLQDTIEQERPDVIIHAAALKRIDDMERNPDECRKTNIVGSENVCKAVIRSNHIVKKCVLVSTDKACMPVNVYGASKFVGERIFAHYGQKRSQTEFLSVRYGNVIASRGSFIPLWQEKLQKGEEIPITHEECARFLFTLNDAVRFVLYALDVSEFTGGRGEVFIPFLKPYKILDVLKCLANIEGTKDYKIKDIGIRPGEKLHEDMLNITETPRSWLVKHPFQKNAQEIVCVMPPDIYLHSYELEYSEYNKGPMNTSLNINKDMDELTNLIKRGLSETN